MKFSQFLSVVAWVNHVSFHLSHRVGCWMDTRAPSHNPKRWNNFWRLKKSSQIRKFSMENRSLLFVAFDWLSFSLFFAFRSARLSHLPLERLTFDKDTILGIPEEILKNTFENNCEVNENENQYFFFFFFHISYVEVFFLFKGIIGVLSSSDFTSVIRLSARSAANLPNAQIFSETVWNWACYSWEDNDDTRGVCENSCAKILIGVQSTIKFRCFVEKNLLFTFMHHIFFLLALALREGVRLGDVGEVIERVARRSWVCCGVEGVRSLWSLRCAWALEVYDERTSAKSAANTIATPNHCWYERTYKQWWRHDDVGVFFVFFWEVIRTWP